MFNKGFSRGTCLEIKMSLESTFFAALRSVGTAATLTMAGFYLHRRGFVNAEGKKSMARLSEQVTIPCLFFSKIINCPQNFSQEECPNITDNLADVWVLLVWPLFVVGVGILIGILAVSVAGTPPKQRRSVIAACAFPNSTGLPITLLTVVHANFPQTSELGRFDPNLFLSIYLILYPVLQWGIGGWLLAPGDIDEDIEMDLPVKSNEIHHVLNLPETEKMSVQAEAAARMIKELSLSDLIEWKQMQKQSETNGSLHQGERIHMKLPASSEFTQLVPIDWPLSTTLAINPADDIAPWTETMTKVIPKALQPPVVGALLGLLIASFPALRGLFVDLNTRANRAPLEWFFDGIYSVNS